VTEPVPGTAAGRTAGEIRQYLLTQFNQALRRLGMYGGEIAIRLLADALAFTDRREPQWDEALGSLRTQGRRERGRRAGCLPAPLGRPGPAP
jgi:hypothetical protein